MAEITIKTAAGSRQVAAAWCGAHLAVHRPVRREDASGKPAPRQWCVTHIATGYSASGTLSAAQRDVLALARLWDGAFAPVTVAGNVKGWRWTERWGDDLRRLQSGRPILGPREITPLERLDSAGTASEVEAAVRAAMGYPGMAPEEAEAQYPADITKRTAGAGAVRRCPDTGALELWWLPRGGNYPNAEAISLAGWYPVPAAGDVERWCLGSVAETPCGDRVEPDHPDAWPRLLGVI